MSDKYDAIQHRYQTLATILREAREKIVALGDAEVGLPRIEAPSDIVAILGDYIHSDEYIAECAEQMEAEDAEYLRDEHNDNLRKDRALDVSGIRHGYDTLLGAAMGRRS